MKQGRKAWYRLALLPVSKACINTFYICDNEPVHVLSTYTIRWIILFSSYFIISSVPFLIYKMLT